MGFVEMLCVARVPSILTLGLVYCSYVLIGGVIFWKLEGDLGKEDVARILSDKRQVLMTYSCLNQEGLEAVAQVRHKHAGASKDVALMLHIKHVSLGHRFTAVSHSLLPYGCLL